MSNPITFNEADSRYEQDFDGHVVYARTHMKDNVLYVDYVFAPPELRGKGASSSFMKDLMAVAREKNYMVTPVCGFASAWLRKHDEYKEIVVS